MNVIKQEPAAKYHQCFDAWSRSMLSTFRESKREAYLRYIEKSAPEGEYKPCMKLGSLAHCMLFEPDIVVDAFPIIPTEILASNGAISTKAAKAFVEEASAHNRTAVKQTEWDESKRIVDSVRKVCGKWLEKATKVEHSIYWKDEVSGLMLKARPDWFIETADQNIIFDLKTTNRIVPHQFSRVIEQHEYWLQETHYRQGLTAINGKPSVMYFVGIEQSWPFRCALFQLTDETRSKSFEAWRFLLAEVGNAVEKNDWQDSWESAINPINLNDYVFRRTA